MTHFVRLHRRIDQEDRNRYRDLRPVLFVAASRIIAFGDSYTDGVTGKMTPEGAWVQVPAGDCGGDGDQGVFRVTETADEIAALVEGVTA